MLSTMVFCYQNCSDLLSEKKCSSDGEKFLKFEAEGRKFAKNLRSLKYGFYKKSPGEKVFNWSEVHLSEVTSYKIHTLEQFFHKGQ